MKILYIGDTEGVSGYAQTTRRMVFCLQDAGIDLVVRHVPHDTNISLDTIGLNRVRSLYGEFDGKVAIHHQIPHMFSPIPGCFNIGYTMFETSQLPEEWAGYCHKMDEIWVPSVFNKNIFQQSGIKKPIHVVPFPIPAHYAVASRATHGVFRFLSMFQWTERKNWRALLTAYFKEFRANEDVELYIKAYGANAGHYEKSIVEQQISDLLNQLSLQNRPKYHLDFSIRSEKELVQIIQNSDIFVLPSRGEAVGLGYLESMACGKPCIATSWGGQLEFINDSNGFLVPYSLEPVDNIPHIQEYRRTQNWASVNIPNLSRIMRTAFANRISLATKGAAARQIVETNYSNEAVGKIVRSRLSQMSRSPQPTALSVSYVGDAYGLTGYSNAIRLNLKILKQAEVQVKLFPVHHDRRRIESGLEKLMLDEMVGTKNGTILINHQTPEFFGTVSGNYVHRIGVTYFETDRIPQKWVEPCNSMDELWLSCEATKSAFSKGGVSVPMHIIDPFIDTDHFHPNTKPWNIINRASFNFVSVFDFIPRKGWDVLIEAFARAFKKNDDVCLIIRTHRMHPPITEDEIKKIFRSHLQSVGLTEWPRILVYSQPIPYQAMPSLYRSGDVFVLPTRGESICYPAMEAMACGLPAIITSGGGQSQFVDENNGYLLPFTLTPVRNFHNSPWYSSDQMMTEPDIHKLIYLMRYVYENRDEVKIKGNLARQTIDKNHSMTNCGTKMLLRLSKIASDKTL